MTGVLDRRGESLSLTERGWWWGEFGCESRFLEK